MARKQLPDNVHHLKGTHRKDRHGDPKSKPQVELGAPKCPQWLTPKAKTIWKQTTQTLEKAKVITKADEGILSQFCMLLAEFKDQKYDFPAAKHTQLRLCAVELGLTPSARSKITVGDVGQPGEFDDF